MSYQKQQPQTTAGQQPRQTTGQQGPVGTGQGMGQQMGQQAGQGMGQQAGQQMGMRLQDVESPQERAAVENIVRAIQVCEFCADQCIQLGDPNMVECIRLCEDVSELGESALALLPRQSRYAGTVLQAFQQAAQACAQECGRHQHAHCQECAQLLPQAATATQQYLASGGQGGQ